MVSGHIDPASGKVQRGEMGRVGMNDCLDDLAEMVLRMKGTVVVVPRERMPTESGLAAVYRY